jgi:hypothetical protein
VAQTLETAGVLIALHAEIPAARRQQAAAIFNDYGFFATQAQKGAQADLALRRAIALDPKRALAKLNLAEALYARLSTMEWDRKPGSRVKSAASIVNIFGSGGASSRRSGAYRHHRRPAPVLICARRSRHTAMRAG